MNLVINASEAICEKVGTVTVHTRRVTLAALDVVTLIAGTEIEPGNYVCLTVSDTGCGITAEAMPHIFEPFYTTKFVGRGLGLAAVLGIVQGHRGGVQCTSAEGQGTTFELYFPVSSPPPAAPAGVAAPPLAAMRPARGTVLVVDDEEAVRRLAISALTAAGFSVVTADDGTEALAHLRRGATRYDAVLLDLVMPKLDGEDTFVALHMLAPKLPVILTSGVHEQAAVTRFVARGLADFLPKPFTAEMLVTLVTAAIQAAEPP